MPSYTYRHGRIANETLKPRTDYDMLSGTPSTALTVLWASYTFIRGAAFGLRYRLVDCNQFAQMLSGIDTVDVSCQDRWLKVQFAESSLGEFGGLRLSHASA
ncbi:hypothetical protein Baya_6676 [Bagarius yarrelli]|uniref:Uncharacterized protein n=1 Tax=Bagarius yarrelli TaxID=175774 RepID=A0A556U1J1_BAGYA|nr:hypothetical protein Baya_6676 [Bagarius yarrelli]